MSVTLAAAVGLHFAAFCVLGDPLVRLPSGCQWYLQGVAGKVYNLINGPDDTLNTLLVPANLTDASHSANGTYHGTLSIRHKDNLVETTVDPEGNLTGTPSDVSGVTLLCHARLTDRPLILSWTVCSHCGRQDTALRLKVYSGPDQGKGCQAHDLLWTIR